eukprot:CAMPEP_0179490062 /NCGR_PEP_ID=MMETSP0799-20121207/65228_1 /TAXON_ID=46947 /ORGANISM="Geminigera cryophila, Strain CCMP2564" /LENGTH=84 /DNA_ID=CAMNT_0021306169 /DNA_START=651 /DNA_END=902 /DNA_ORIENTATION=-
MDAQHCGATETTSCILGGGVSVSSHALRRRDTSAARKAVGERDFGRGEFHLPTVSSKLRVRAVILKLDRDGPAASLASGRVLDG